MVKSKFIPILAIASSFTLAGCAELAKYEAQQEAKKTQQRIEIFKNTCVSMGFASDTPENAMCVLEMEKSYIQAEAQRKASNSGGMGFMCKDAIARGDSMAVKVHCD